MSLGERLKQARKQRKLTQPGVARLTGINYKTLSNWETDFYRPNVDELKKLALLYNVSIDFLMEMPYNSKNKLSPIFTLINEIITANSAEFDRLLPDNTDTETINEEIKTMPANHKEMIRLALLTGLEYSKIKTNRLSVQTRNTIQPSVRRNS